MRKRGRIKGGLPCRFLPPPAPNKWGQRVDGSGIKPHEDRSEAVISGKKRGCRIMVLLQPSKQGGYQRETFSNLPNFSEFPGLITHLNNPPSPRGRIKGGLPPAKRAQVGNKNQQDNQDTGPRGATLGRERNQDNDPLRFATCHFRRKTAAARQFIFTFFTCVFVG
jgi:hypothetical protein